jgi:hypothetical protein
MLRFLKQCDGQSVDPVVLGMRSDEFNEYDAPAEIESNDHPKIAASDFKPRAFPVRDFCIRSGDSHVVHRIPFGASDQCSPALERRLRLRMPFGVRRKRTPCDNSHAWHYVPKMGTLQRQTNQTGNNSGAQTASIIDAISWRLPANVMTALSP